MPKYKVGDRVELRQQWVNATYVEVMDTGVVVSNNETSPYGSYLVSMDIIRWPFSSPHTLVEQKWFFHENMLYPSFTFRSLIYDSSSTDTVAMISRINHICEFVWYTPFRGERHEVCKYPGCDKTRS